MQTLTAIFSKLMLKSKAILSLSKSAQTDHEHLYEKCGMKVCVDGGFMYVYLDSGYHQVFEISFCPQCGADLRE